MTEDCDNLEVSVEEELLSSRRLLSHGKKARYLLFSCYFYLFSYWIFGFLFSFLSMFRGYNTRCSCQFVLL